MADEIIKELWKIKDGIANEHGCDVKALAAHLRAKKHQGEQQVVDLRSMKQTAEHLENPDSATQRVMKLDERLKACDAP